VRSHWPRPSGGTLGEGTEESLSRVRYPSELHVDAEFEIAAPLGNLYAASAVHVAGKMMGLESTGTELSMAGADAPLVTADGAVKARLTGVHLAMRDAYVGETAAVNV
jgi:hypothetical protein